MLFIEPIWLSILIPILFALVLLIASLAARHWRRDGFGKAAWLSTASLVLAFVTGGALFAAILVGFVLFTHWIALAIERAADRRHREAPSGSLPAQVWLVFAVGVHLAMVAAILRPGVITGPLQRIRGTIVSGDEDQSVNAGEGADDVTNAQARGDDSFASEISSGEARGEDNSPSDGTDDLG